MEEGENQVDRSSWAAIIFCLIQSLAEIGGIMKKIKWSIVLGLSILFLGFLYFRPLSLEKDLTKIKDVIVLNIVFKNENGQPETIHEVYDNLSENQINRIVELLKEYSYRRKIGTFFSDGSIQEAEYIVSVYVYNEDYKLTSITLTEKDEVCVGNRKFRMENSEQLVYEIIKIAKESEK